MSIEDRLQQNLLLIRRCVGWTAIELGEKIGVTRQTINNLEANKPDRVKDFMADIQKFVKDILGRFDDFQFFVGESMDSEASVALMFYKEDGVTPYFYYMRDGLKEEKY